MVPGEPIALVNAILCTLIVATIMLYRRNGARYRVAISCLAYVTVLIYASVPFRFLFGFYQQPHWLVVFVNLLICAAILMARGNLARLVDILR